MTAEREAGGSPVTAPPHTPGRPSCTHPAADLRRDSVFAHGGLGLVVESHDRSRADQRRHGPGCEQDGLEGASGWGHVLMAAWAASK